MDDTLIMKYLPDHPVMAMGWMGALHWAIGQTECLETFRADTGIAWTPGRTPIDRMIDDATGADHAFIEAFIPWFHANVWGQE
jgi:hypothetical protein